MFLCSQLERRLWPFLSHLGGDNKTTTKNALGKARLLVVRAERVVYLGERSTRRIVIRLEFSERRLEFTVKRERDVDLTFSTLRRE